MTVEGVHFRREWVSLPEAAGRAVLAALSDLAAMAAEPVGVLLSMAIAPDERGAVEAISARLGRVLREMGVPLLGGDLTASTGALVLDVVAIGRSESPMLRSGVSAGDELWVTGRLGGAGLAVRSWESGVQPPSEARLAFVSPKPRVEEALWLRTEARATAGLDLSDGLAGDAGHLAAASGVGMTLDLAEVPVFPGSDLATAIHAGEDYELLVAAPPGVLEPLAPEFELRFGVPLTRVGRAEGPGGLVSLRGADGVTRPANEGGFDHFGRSGES
jgi:thiamine-monophosphate kinase